MTTLSADPPLLAIVGPTASGKSVLGVFLAREFGGEIVACDSLSFIADLTLGQPNPPRPN